MPTQATTKWGARGCTNSSADYADQTIADRVVLGSQLSVAWVGYKVRLTLFRIKLMGLGALEI